MFRLRRVPSQNLTGEEVQSILGKYGFYCSGEFSWSNPGGKGIANNFTSVHSGQTILDGATGLLWQRSGSPKSMTFSEAQKYIEELNRQEFAGYSDWRLPTLEETMSLMEPAANRRLYIDAKFDAEQGWIWTSDIYSAGRAWYVGFLYGYCHPNGIVNGNYVRAVRS